MKTQNKPIPSNQNLLFQTFYYTEMIIPKLPCMPKQSEKKTQKLQSLEYTF